MSYKSTIFESLKNCRIAVIGAGYLGTHLFEYLQTYAQLANYQLTLFSRANINEISCNEYDYVFNCAGNTGNFRQNVTATIESNLSLTAKILNDVVIKRAYVGMSSSRVYGFSTISSEAFSENSILPCKQHLDVDFIYDGTKKLLESMVLNAGSTKSFKVIMCRLSNLYGRFNKHDLDNSTYLKVMLKHASENKSLVINQNSESTKGYIYIDDAVEGILRGAVFSPKNGIYNICSGESYSIKDWVKALNLHSTIGLRFEGPVFSRIDISKAQNEIGFSPRNFLNTLNINKIYKHERDSKI